MAEEKLAQDDMSSAQEEAEIAVDQVIPGSEGEKVASLEEQLAQKQEEIAGLQDRLLRMAAEMENTRKRLEREKQDGISFANECFMRELLTVIDNLERAVQHGEQDSSVQGLLDGVQMTLKTFSDVLSRFGCKSFESVGNPFDPNFHEAVMQQPSAEHLENTVLQELRKGYTLNERLLRPAMVVVSKAPAQA